MCSAGDICRVHPFLFGGDLVAPEKDRNAAIRGFCRHLTLLVRSRKEAAMPDSSQKLPPLARSWDDVGKKLFVPEHYEFSDMEQLCAFISDYPVGQMVTHQNQETKISAVPFVIENNTFGGRPLLLGHMAERNEQASAVRGRQLRWN